MTLIMKCGECGSSDIVLLESVVCRTPIGSWSRDADGILQYELMGGTDVDWNSQRPIDEELPYECSECGCGLSDAGLDAEESNDD